MKTTKEKIAVMQAFEDTGSVRMNERGYPGWEITKIPAWDWVHFDYDIKPQTLEEAIEEYIPPGQLYSLSVRDRDFYIKIAKLGIKWKEEQDND